MTTQKHAVQMIPPPPDLIGPVNSLIMDAVAKIPHNKDFMATIQVDTEAGINAAAVLRVNGNVSVLTYFGKKWQGPISAGVAAVITL